MLMAVAYEIPGYVVEVAGHGHFVFDRKHTAKLLKVGHPQA